MTPKNDIKKAFNVDLDEDFMLSGVEPTNLEYAEDEVYGQLAIDIYQTATDVVIKAPIAGVDPKDIDLTVTDEMVAIKGVRKEEKEVDYLNYHSRECYWGGFFRSETLPCLVTPEKAAATFKNGILTIRIPKASHSKLRKVKIVSE